MAIVNDLINLTPHNVNIIENGKCVLTITPTLPSARCVEKFYEGFVVEYAGLRIPAGTLTYAQVYNLPDEVPGTKYIVSVLVAQQYPWRLDLLVPHDLVRKDGQIIGCKRLVRIV